jgi:hypothetical protein
MAFTMGEDKRLPRPILAVSEAVSTSLGSITSVTTPVVDTECAHLSVLTSAHQGDTADDSGNIVEKWISLSFTWSGRSFTLEIAHSDRLDGL